MLILTWVGIIFVKILHLAIARCKIMTNIMPTHVKISIEPGIRELFLKLTTISYIMILFKFWFICRIPFYSEFGLEDNKKKSYFCATIIQSIKIY